MTIKKLLDTEDGDVFYPVTAPWEVWQRRRGGEDYPFMQIGSECDFQAGAVGNGDLSQAVTVVHNTYRAAQNFTEALADARQGGVASHESRGT